MDDKREKKNEQHAANPPPSQRKPPSRGESGTLFTQTGPVALGGQKRGIVSLGRIGTTRPAGSRPDVPPVSAVVGPEEKREASSGEQPREAVTYTPTVAASGSTRWSPTRWEPRIDPASYVHPAASVIGNVIVGPGVFIAAGAVIRGENEEPISVGAGSNIQEGVVIKDLPTRPGGEVDERRIVEVQGEKYTVYIGEAVSICAQAQVHGPAHVADGVYLGMQSLVFWARVEKGVVIEPGCLIMNVTVPSGRFVPAGLKVTSQNLVEDLPELTGRYRFHDIGDQVAGDNQEMLRAYRELMRRG